MQETSVCGLKPELWKNGNHVLAVLLMDASGSMFTLRTAVVEAMNGHLDTLKTAEKTDNVSTVILSFNSTVQCLSAHDLVQKAQPARGFFPEGGTRLYGVLREILEEILPHVEAAKGRLKLVLAAFTDGMDRDSTTADLEAVKELSVKLQLLNADLVFVGFGVDAKAQAVEMRWPRDLACRVKASASGVQTSMHSVSRTTMTSIVCFHGKPN